MPAFGERGKDFYLTPLHPLIGCQDEEREGVKERVKYAANLLELIEETKLVLSPHVALCAITFIDCRCATLV